MLKRVQEKLRGIKHKLILRLHIHQDTMEEVEERISVEKRPRKDFITHKQSVS